MTQLPSGKIIWSAWHPHHKVPPHRQATRWNRQGRTRLRFVGTAAILPAMLKLAHLVAIASAFMASAASAEPMRLSQSQPAIGETATATAGSPMFQRESFTAAKAVQLDADASLTGLFTVKAKAGETIRVVREDAGLVACKFRDGYEYICLRDKDLDGIFDGKSTESAPLFWMGAGNSVRYHAIDPIRLEGEPGAFRQVLGFLGVSGQTLRLSYREFADDMARPAFTDEITFTLSGKFPERVAYRDLAIDVLGVDNAGMRYVIVNASK